ncbi:MAG: pentapeptide repeat-containing protein [Methylocella sp.]
MADEPGNEPPAKDPSKKYDQAFFLALAAQGREAWNAWRRDPANKTVPVTFAGVDFSQAPRGAINFEGFEFGDHADFSGCKWRGGKIEGIEFFAPGRTRFTGAAFGIGANLTRVTFSDQADFTNAAFGAWAAFDSSAFGDVTYFSGATFGDWAKFIGAAFGKGAYFTGVIFNSRADFTGAIFGDLAIFAGAAFGEGVNFDHATFGDRSKFTGAAFGPGAVFSHVRFKGAVEFAGMSGQQLASDSEATLRVMNEEARAALEERHKVWGKFYGSGPDRFLSISFANARFFGEADFSGRSFETIADFTNARFYYPPDFDAASHLDRIDFTGADIGFVRPGRPHWTSKTAVPIRLRALRKIAEETKNHDLERDLYIEERKAERGVYLHQLLGREELKKNLEDINQQKKHVWLEWRLQRRARNAHWLRILANPDIMARLITHILWIFVMGVYWALADYGRSFLLPIEWLVASVFFFYWRYAAILTPLTPKVGELNADKYERAVEMLALGNAVPFVGPLTIDSKIKEFLLCPGGAANCLPVPSENYQLLVLGQNTLSIILVFFIGLALRNYFKIK